jgi:hypothetical protein
MQRLVLRQDPNAISSSAIRNICVRMRQGEGRIEAKGGLQLFWQQVVGVA